MLWDSASSDSLPNRATKGGEKCGDKSLQQQRRESTERFETEAPEGRFYHRTQKQALL